MEVGWARVGDAPRLAAGQGQQLSHALRQLGQAFDIGKKRQLRHAPWRFQPVGGHRKIHQCGGLARGVHPLEVGQGLGEGRRQQAIAFHGGKVFAVDPDQVHRAFGVFAAGLLFGAHTLDHIARVADLDVLQLHTKVALQLACGPLQVSVDALAARPGVEVHGLATRSAQGVGPSGGRSRGRTRGGLRPCGRDTGHQHSGSQQRERLATIELSHEVIRVSGPKGLILADPKTSRVSLRPQPPIHNGHAAIARF